MTAKPDGGKPDVSLPSPEYQALMALVNGGWISQMIHVVAKLGIADLLTAGGKTSTELARAVGVHATSLYRVLRALASVGVFAEDDQGCFFLTPLAEPLRSDAPDSVRGWAVFIGEPQQWHSWEALEYSVQTGETAFQHVWGMPNWEYRAQNPEANAIFNQAMISAAYRRIGPVLAAYDFSGIQTLVDVGGGVGAFLAAILRNYPAMHGILFDLPHVVSGATRVLKGHGVANRCKIISGNFMDPLSGPIPGGGDAYFLSKVIHDWDDEKAVAILKGCRQAMQSGSKLLLVEAVIPPGNVPHPDKLQDINMLIVNTGGRERTEAEFHALLAAAGFTLNRITSTPGEVSVIEGSPL